MIESTRAVKSSETRSPTREKERLQLPEVAEEISQKSRWYFGLSGALTDVDKGVITSEVK